MYFMGHVIKKNDQKQYLRYMFHLNSPAPNSSTRPGTVRTAHSYINNLDENLLHTGAPLRVKVKVTEAQTYEK